VRGRVENTATRRFLNKARQTIAQPPNHQRNITRFAHHPNAVRTDLCEIAHMVRRGALANYLDVTVATCRVPHERSTCGLFCQRSRQAAAANPTVAIRFLMINFSVIGYAPTRIAVRYLTLPLTRHWLCGPGFCCEGGRESRPETSESRSKRGEFEALQFIVRKRGEPEASFLPGTSTGIPDQVRHWTISPLSHTVEVQLDEDSAEWAHAFGVKSWPRGVDARGR
jgi:hypothetical protein